MPELLSESEPCIIEEESECQDLESDIDVNTDQSPMASQIISFIIAFLLRFQIVYKISDNAIALLLRFLRCLILTIGRSFNIPTLNENIHFPKSLYGCQSLIGIRHAPFKEFVVCPTCHLLYDPSIQQLTHGENSIKCKFIRFPHHPQARFRLPCNTTLMNRVKACDGKVKFRARKTFYYYGFKAALTYFLRRPGFLNICNSWEKRVMSDSLMHDIIDGRVWIEMFNELAMDGRTSNLLGFLVNIDWFQPFKHISYSVGVVYAVILNLPRDIRYKDDNVIIVGVIPGPSEPKHDINSYLGPMVSELLELYSGLWFMTSLGRQFIRGVLLCFSSDIPATRKAAGFVGLKGVKGCSRCLKSFPTNSDRETDYSGFQRESWGKRANQEHRQYAYREFNAKTKAEKKVIERQYGARYSILFELPYYDCVRFVVVDIMHNLFLGTAKKMMNIWQELEILDHKAFEIIQKRIMSVNVPRDVGRIPYKIESGMAGMTADQWKNWTCIYSIYALHGLLPSEHLDCWWLFVQACIFLCQPLISHADINKGDLFIMEFCKEFEKLYGPNKCSPNMHLHCHIAECLRDYGPAHATWCFSFERYNGILGSIPNNNKSLDVEKTMIKHFVQQTENYGQVVTEFSSVMDSFFNESMCGSVGETMSSNNVVEILKLSQPLPLSQFAYSHDYVSPIGTAPEHAMNPELVKHLTEMYRVIFSKYSIINVSCLCRRFDRVKLGDTLYSSKKARTDRNSFICANWLGENDLIDPAFTCRPGSVQYYIKHTITVTHNGEKLLMTSYLAFVKWYKKHPEKNYFHPPNTIWYPDYAPPSQASFMPISRIACRCMQDEFELSIPDRPHNNGKVVVVNPISRANLLF